VRILYTSSTFSDSQALCRGDGSLSSAEVVSRKKDNKKKQEKFKKSKKKKGREEKQIENLAFRIPPTFLCIV
jgi:hypothetical protein